MDPSQKGNPIKVNGPIPKSKLIKPKQKPKTEQVQENGPYQKKLTK